jgi:carbohydrate diacid regulator
MFKDSNPFKPFQDLVENTSEIIGLVVGIVGENGVVICCSDQNRVDSEILNFSFEESYETFTHDGNTYKPFGEKFKSPDMAIFVEGINSNSEKYAETLALTFTNIKEYFDEKHNKANFIKNVILGNYIPTELITKTRELRINTEAPRITYIIRNPNAQEISVFDVIQSMFPDKNKDFVFTQTNGDVILVKEIKPSYDMPTLIQLAETILDTVSAETFVNVNIGIGTPALNIRDLSSSYRNAQTALEVGKVFDTESRIVNYSALGIARLIYHLPEPLCGTFLDEIFKKGSVESLDQETLFTIQKFFENNLNVSETSRRLFVHRNSLVYRLEKIKKLTGLDLREFYHAIVFKIALMVKKLLSSKPKIF